MKHIIQSKKTAGRILTVFLLLLVSNILPLQAQQEALRKLSIAELVMVVCLARATEKERAVIELMQEMSETTNILNGLTDIEKKLLEGTSLDNILSRFSLTGYLVTAVCGIAVLLLLHLLLKNLSIYKKVKTTLSGIWEGVLSLRGIRNLPLYLFFSIGIWVCYFLHYYLTFFCFDFTADLGIGCALVSFVVANFAVLVPTPNGAGPWHFAIKTMLILYGVQDEHALFFVLIVHTVQTFLVIALGIWAWARLSLMDRINPKTV